MRDQKILDEVRAYVKEHMSSLQFHNFQHAEHVVQEALVIGKAEGLTDHELYLLEISAWFHDVGYESDQPCASGHEERSAQSASEFLSGKLSEEDIKTVEKCILATKLGAKLSSTIEQVISDADLSHLGKENFYEQSDALRKEFDKSSNCEETSKKKWLLKNLQFLCSHKYCTDYAKKVYRPEKKRHIEEIELRLESMVDETPTTEPVVEKKEKKKKKKENGDKPRRDVETMYRILARNQMSLSAIADRKASILLSINSIITSFAIGYLFRKVDEYPQLAIPSLIFALTGLVSVILAVIATRPNVKKKGKPQDISNVNLLFFENFVDMPLEDYQSALKDQTKTSEQIYDSLSRDTYYLGQVLAIKYKRVRFAFNFFMFGLSATVLSFILSFSLVV